MQRIGYIYAQDVLTSPLLGNLLILIAAIIGVGGSYWIYRIRRNDTKRKTRRILKNEMESMWFFDDWQNRMNSAPANQVAVTSAYRSNAGNIGLLTDEEIEYITQFYTSAESLNHAIEMNVNTIQLAGSQANVIDQERQYREQILESKLDFCVIYRWKAIQFLRKQLDEDYQDPELIELPKSSGDLITGEHPIIRKYQDMLFDENSIEVTDEDANIYRVTDTGEARFDPDSNEYSGDFAE